MIAHQISTRSLSRLYIAIAVLSEPLFWGPVLLQALAQNAGLSQEQIFLSEAWAIALVIILDTPLGALADQVGRKRCVLIGKTIGVITVILLAVMNKPWHAYLAQTLWAIEVGLVGGAESAMVRDTYAARGQLQAFDKLIARVLTIKFAVSAITAIAAGYLAKYSLYLPMLLSIPGVIIGYVLTFYFPEEGVRAGTKKAHLHLIDGVKELKKNASLRNCFILIAVYMSISKALLFTFNPYMSANGIDMGTVGVVFTATMLMASIGSRYSIKISKMHMCYCLLGMCALHLLVATTPVVLGCICYALQGLVRGYANWWSQKTSQDLIVGDSRATLLSLKSSMTQVASLIVFGLMSLIANDIYLTLAALSSISIIIGLLSLIKRK